MAKTVTKIIDGISLLGASTSTLSQCTTIDTSSVVYLEIEAVATYHTSAASGVSIAVYGATSDSESVYTTYPIEQFNLPFTANTTQRWSRYVAPGEKYMRVLVDNLEDTQTASSISVYATTMTL